MIDESTQQSSLKRLARIEGQVRGISKMVTEGRYCIDIINQVTAVRRALERVALEVMKRHVNSCVKSAILRGEGEGLTDELIETVDRFLR